MIDFIDYSDPYVTVISKNSLLEANITTTSSIEVLGVVNGNIETEALSSIYGKVNGNVSARDLITRENSRIVGDIQLVYDGLIDFHSNINGNVTCKNIEIYGEIKGNIKAEGSVIIRSSANILGDITCKSLVVDEGARINGNVKLLFQLSR